MDNKAPRLRINSATVVLGLIDRSHLLWKLHVKSSLVHFEQCAAPMSEQQTNSFGHIAAYGVQLHKVFGRSLVMWLHEYQQVNTKCTSQSAWHLITVRAKVGRGTHAGCWMGWDHLFLTERQSFRFVAGWPNTPKIFGQRLNQCRRTHASNRRLYMLPLHYKIVRLSDSQKKCIQHLFWMRKCIHERAAQIHVRTAAHFSTASPLCGSRWLAHQLYFAVPDSASKPFM